MTTSPLSLNLRGFFSYYFYAEHNFTDEFPLVVEKQRTQCAIIDMNMMNNSVVR